MKKINRIVYFLVSASLLSACNTNTGQKMENAVDTVTTKVENAVDSAKANYAENRDEDFVQDVIKSNTAELHLLALAQKKSNNKELKGHAKVMEADHKKLLETLKDYAAKKNIKADVDSSDIKSHFDDDKPGTDWDKNWVDKMVNAHESGIDKFEKKEKNAADEELKTIVSNALPKLRSHLDMMKELQAKMQK